MTCKVDQVSFHLSNSLTHHRLTYFYFRMSPQSCIIVQIVNSKPFSPEDNTKLIDHIRVHGLGNPVVHTHGFRCIKLHQDSSFIDKTWQTSCTHVLHGEYQVFIDDKTRSQEFVHRKLSVILPTHPIPLWTPYSNQSLIQSSSTPFYSPRPLLPRVQSVKATEDSMKTFQARIPFGTLNDPSFTIGKMTKKVSLAFQTFRNRSNMV